VTPQEVEARRDRSAALFNNRYFGDVARTILEITDDGSDMVTARKIASSTGLSDSLVRPVLLRLVAAGALAKLDKTGSDRGAQYYLVRDPDTLRSIVALHKVAMSAQQ
jgi:hypothetical protein